MGKAGGLFVNLGINTGQFTKGIRGARKELTGFQKIGAGLKNTFSPAALGFGAMAAGTALIGAAIGDAVKIFKEFEKANSELKAVLGASKGEMASLSDEAIKLGSATSYTAAEVTSLQTSFAKLGFDSTAIKNMTASTLDAAAALGSELGEQATLTGATLASFGLDSTKAAQVNDILALSASKSALDFSKLSTALPIVGSVAKTVGLSLQRTTAILGTLSNNGMDASSSATALRNILVKLASKGMTWEEAMTKINNSTNKAKTSFDLFGKTSVAAGVILAEQGATVDELTKSLNNADGAAQEMADTMLNNLAGDVTKAGSAWERFVLTIVGAGDIFSDISRHYTQGASSILNSLSDLGSASIGWKDKMKIVFNSIISGANGLLGMFSMILPVIDRIAGTDLAGAIEIPHLKLTTDNVNNLDKATKKLTISQLFAKKQKLEQLYVKAGLSAEEAAIKVKSLMDAQRDLSLSTKKAALEAKKAAEIAKYQGEETDKLASSITRLAAVPKIELKTSLTADDQSIANMSNDIKASLDNKGLAIRVPVEVTGVQTALANAKFFNEQIKVLEADQRQRDLDKIEQGRETAAAVGQAFSTIGASMVANLGLAEGAMGAFQATMAQLAIDLIAQALSTSIANAIIAGTASGAASGPAAAFVTPALIASTVGSVIGAFASIPAFADGGLVTGATMGLVGEGRGTSQSNPEVIAPLDKLQNMIAGSGGGMSGGEVVFRIQGQELVGILNRQNKVNKFS